MNIQRFSPWGWCNLEGELKQDDNGSWVRYEDYLKLANHIREVEEEIQEAIRELKDYSHEKRNS
jgi:hypothetical protein